MLQDTSYSPCSVKWTISPSTDVPVVGGHRHRVTGSSSNSKFIIGFKHTTDTCTYLLTFRCLMQHLRHALCAVHTCYDIFSISSIFCIRLRVGICTEVSCVSSLVSSVSVSSTSTPVSDVVGSSLVSTCTPEIRMMISAFCLPFHGFVLIATLHSLNSLAYLLYKR